MKKNLTKIVSLLVFAIVFVSCSSVRDPEDVYSEIDYTQEDARREERKRILDLLEKNPVQAKAFSDKVLRKMDRSSIEYAMLRCYHDQGGGAMPLPQKISAIESRQKQGKMYFYLGLLSELYSTSTESNEWYAKVLSMSSPMFFEYRLAEWSAGTKNAK